MTVDLAPGSWKQAPRDMSELLTKPGHTVLLLGWFLFGRAVILGVYFYFWFFKIGFLCVVPVVLVVLGCPCSVDQAGLELIEILLPLPPKCWD